MTKHMSVERDFNVLAGKNARDALVQESDQDFLSEDKGIVRVPRERWETAQAAEWKNWMVLNREVRNDRNYQHFLGFAKYSALKRLSFANAIELGCGPFTNMRFIADICRVKECTLLDPLIECYLTHPNCAYAREHLFIEDTRGLLPRLRNALAYQFPKVHRILRNRHKMPIGQILAAPIETMPTDNEYDLVVLINVIEHCYDIYAVFENTTAAMKKDAFIVFHDQYYDHKSIVQSVKTRYDAAHPLQVDRALIDEFLARNFTPVYKRIETHRSTWLTENDSYDCIYYIGKRL